MEYIMKCLQCNHTLVFQMGMTPTCINEKCDMSLLSNEEFEICDDFEQIYPDFSNQSALYAAEL